MTYTATLTREGRFWVIAIDGVGVTQARNLTEARAMAKSLVEIIADDDQSVIEFEFAADEFADIERVRALNASMREIQDEYSKALRVAVGRLRDAGVSGADIAQALEISPQRVSQLQATNRSTSVTAKVGARRRRVRR